MSGIYIPDMQMPEKCGECPFFDDEEFEWCGRCNYNCDGLVDREGKPDWCDLVNVPDHGRLGDLDELEKTFREDADADWNRFAAPINWADAFDDVADMVADAPTIIPSDKEDAE